MAYNRLRYGRVRTDWSGQMGRWHDTARHSSQLIHLTSRRRLSRFLALKYRACQGQHNVRSPCNVLVRKRCARVWNKRRHSTQDFYTPIAMQKTLEPILPNENRFISLPPTRPFPAKSPLREIQPTRPSRTLPSQTAGSTKPHNPYTSIPPPSSPDPRTPDGSLCADTSDCGR